MCLTLTKTPTMPFILCAMPMTLWSLLIGYLFILRGSKLEGDKRREVSSANIWRFLAELSPITIVIGMMVVFTPLSNRAMQWAIENEWLKQEIMLFDKWPIMAGLVLSLLWLSARRGLDRARFLKIMKRKQIWAMVLMVLGIMAFQEVIKQGNAISAFQTELNHFNVPLPLVVAILPFVAGMLIGIAYGYVATSFPFIIPLLGGVVAPEDQARWFFLAYAMGYVGMMVSPTHMCFILTADYFKASLRQIYAFILPICALTACVISALFLLYGLL